MKTEIRKDVEVTQVFVHEIKKGDIVADSGGSVEITEAWADQGKGLGIVLKGTYRGTNNQYFRRFYDVNQLVTVEE